MMDRGLTDRGAAERSPSRLRKLPVLLAVAAASVGAASPAIAAPICAVRDTFQSFSYLAARTAGLPAEQQVRAVRDDYIARHSDLYAPPVMPSPSDERILSALAAARAHPEWRALDAALGPTLEHVADNFERTFPDFRCDFPVYVIDTFRNMTGAGRVVGGRPALVLD